MKSNKQEDKYYCNFCNKKIKKEEIKYWYPNPNIQKNIIKKESEDVNYSDINIKGRCPKCGRACKVYNKNRYE